MDKLEVSRRQLGVALQLYLDDGDSVSIQCLAAGGGELAERLSSSMGKRNFFDLAMGVSELSLAEMRQARSVYWNAFKHFTDHADRTRDDQALFATFDDEANELVLFVGWFDYMNAAESLPIEAQVFQVWVWAKRLDRLGEGHDRAVYEEMFPHLEAISPEAQKAALKAKIAWASGQIEVMKNVKTDRRPLVLPAVASAGV